ncbi:MAG: hypothetical protein EOO14_00995 [Chitinophagaceae bacterium]|nr:MAG: hypothetical protein EOO14_00995 [Chitinophagaceae bacterium]
MRLEKALFFSSGIFLGTFLARQLFNGKIRLRTMAISLDRLQDLLLEKDFESLQFNPFYDNGFLAKDVVTLVAYKKKSGKAKPTMPAVLLEVAGKGKLFANDKDFSAYCLTRADIKTVLDCFEEVPGFTYLQFVPETYRENNGYFSYRLVPADHLLHALAYNFRLMMQTQALMANAGSDETVEAPRQQFFSRTSSGSRALYMDPSPPATAGLCLV